MIRFFEKKTCRCLLLGAVLASLASCADDLPEPIVQPRTAVTVQTDWSGIGEQNIPASYILAVNGEQQTMTATTTQLVLKSNNDYTFVAYVPVYGFAVSDNFVQADASQYSVDNANAINGNPSTFYYGAQTVANLEGEQASVAITMLQATRRLNLSLRLADATDADGNQCTVQGGYAILSEAYATLNMTTSLYATSTEAVSELAFDAATNTLSVPFNLLGLNLERNVDVEFVMFMSNGTQRRVTSTITELVKSFNDGSHTDLNIVARATLSGTSASIDNWAVVDLGDIKPEK